MFMFRWHLHVHCVYHCFFSPLLGNRHEVAVHPSCVGALRGAALMTHPIESVGHNRVSSTVVHHAQHLVALLNN